MQTFRRIVPSPLKNTLKALRLDHTAGVIAAASSLPSASSAATPLQGPTGVATAPKPPAKAPSSARAARRPGVAAPSSLEEQLKAAKELRLQTARERDEARRGLEATQFRLRELERAAKFPDEAWWELRSQLAGPSLASGLRDLVYHPGADRGAYRQILYAGLPDAGYDARPLTELDHLHRLPVESVLHLHESGSMLSGATTEDEARRRADELLEPVGAFVERGGTLLWSVPGEPSYPSYPDVETALLEGLAKLAAGVHLPHESIVDELAPLSGVDPDKRFVVEHPLYTGVYPEVLGWSAARRQLGLSDDDVVLLGYGWRAHDEGLEAALGAFQRLQERFAAPLRLMINGPSTASGDAESLSDVVGAVPGASVAVGAIHPSYLHILFGAADLLVEPPRRRVDPEALFLALTFRLPAVAPATPLTGDLAESGIVHLYDAASGDALRSALAATLERLTPERPRLPPVVAARYDPVSIATQFAGHVRRIAGEG